MRYCLSPSSAACSWADSVRRWHARSSPWRRAAIERQALGCRMGNRCDAAVEAAGNARRRRAQASTSSSTSR